MTISDNTYKWLESMNPFLYLTQKAEKEPLLDGKEVRIFDGIECLIVKGVDFVKYKKALDKGLDVLLVEDNPKKLLSFLEVVDPHPNLYISMSEKEQIYPIIKKWAFKKIQYEGELSEIASYIDGMRLSYSEYQDLGKVILPNILSNLIHVREYIDGADLEGLFKGQEAIVCGSGISLGAAIKEIHQMKHRPLIISVGSSLPILIQEGIIPDFWAFIDPDPPMEKYGCLKDLNIPLFYQNRTARDIVFYHNGPKIFMGTSKGWQIEDVLMHELGRKSFAFDAGCHAGNFGCHIALALGCSKVVLVGMDGVAKEGEVQNLEREGMKTRGDLFYGMEFFKELQTHFPKQKIEHFTHGFSFDEEAKVNQIFVKPKKVYELKDEIEVSQKRVLSVIDELFDHEMKRSLEKLFVEEDEKVQRGKAALLLAEFSIHSFYMHFLSPLWMIYRDLFKDKDVLAEMAFYYQVIKEFDSESGFIGDQFYLLGNKEGHYRRVDSDDVLREEGYFYKGRLFGEKKVYGEKGELISCEEYYEGRRDGPFQVYKDRELVREGAFEGGKAQGRHVCYKKGRVVDELFFDKGKKCKGSKIYSDNGVKLEEIIYRDKDLFDRYVFDERGNKTYEAVWKGEHFFERGFVDQKVVWEREGKMINGKLVFREEF